MRLDDADVLRRATSARNADRFRRLWEGDSGGHSSPSEADMALCSLLAFWTQDPEQIARLVGQSGLYRPKWDRQDYRDATISKVLASRGAAWEPFLKSRRGVTYKVKVGAPGVGKGAGEEAPKGSQDTSSVPVTSLSRLPFLKSRSPVTRIISVRVGQTWLNLTSQSLRRATP
jgi:hypothetical protein